jgi:hypothetical protein
MSKEDDNKNLTRNGLTVGLFLVIAVIIFFVVWGLERQMDIEIPYIESSELKMGFLAAVISAVITVILHFSGQFQKWTDSLYEDVKKN